jgi:hypothetical protein
VRSVCPGQRPFNGLRSPPERVMIEDRHRPAPALASLPARPTARPNGKSRRFPVYREHGLRAGRFDRCWTYAPVQPIRQSVRVFQQDLPDLKAQHGR